MAAAQSSCLCGAEHLTNLEADRNVGSNQQLAPCAFRRHLINADQTKARAQLLGFLGCVVQTILLRPAETPPHGKHWTLFACIYSTFFRVSQVRIGARPTMWRGLAMTMATWHPLGDQSRCTMDVRSPPVLAGLLHPSAAVRTVSLTAVFQCRRFRPCACPGDAHDLF